MNYVRYEMIRVTENRFEPPKNGRGLFNYLWDQVLVKIELGEILR
jgi:hypothetical protein